MRPFENVSAPGIVVICGLATVMRLGERDEVDTAIVAAWLANSRHRRDWAFRTLQEQVLAVRSSPRLALLGLAYKQDTASTKNSLLIPLAPMRGSVPTGVGRE